MILLGIDIGGSHIKLGLVTEDGSVRRRRSHPTPNNATDFQMVVGNELLRLIEESGAPDRVGIACKGVVDRAASRVRSLPGHLRFLEGWSLEELVRPALRPEVPVFCDNDARVALIGEILWGAARGRRNVVMLTLGSGVGGGILADGRVLNGSGGVAGHLGHWTILPDGPECICGSRGCLETLFSAFAIEAEALAAIHRGCESALTERFLETREPPTSREVFAMAAQGDRLARRIIRKAVGYLGAALAGMAHAFDPEIIVLGGTVSKADGQLLIEPLRLDVWNRTERLLGRKVPLLASEIEDRSGIVGAAALARSGGRI